MSAKSDASSVVDLPVPKISQSLNVQKEDFVDYDRNRGEYKKSKTKTHKHIDLYFDKQFLTDYFKV
jgi:hypothetical protein